MKCNICHKNVKETVFRCCVNCVIKLSSIDWIKYNKWGMNSTEFEYEWLCDKFPTTHPLKDQFIKLMITYEL